MSTKDMPQLPRPACTYADHSYPAFNKAQMHGYAIAYAEEQNKALVEVLRTVDTLLDHRHADISLIGEVISKALTASGAA